MFFVNVSDIRKIKISVNVCQVTQTVLVCDKTCPLLQLVRGPASVRVERVAAARYVLPQPLPHTVSGCLVQPYYQQVKLAGCA